MLVYLTVIYILSLNIPVSDDYDMFLEINLQLKNRHELHKSFWEIIWAQHNEHRVVFNKLVSWCQFQLLGMINFRGLILIGNICLFPVFYLLFKQWKELKITDGIFLLLLMLLLTLHPQHAENYLWATGSLQNYGVICFSFLSMFFLFKKSFPYFLLAIFFGLLSVLSSLSGLSILIIGISVLFTFKRSGKEIIIWLIFSLVCIIMYYIDYQKPPLNPSAFQTIINRPINIVLFFFGLIGALFREMMPGSWGAVIMGLLGFGVLCYLLIKYKAFKRSLLFIFFLIIVAAIFLTALGRSWWGLEYSFSNRYRILSALFWLLLMVAVHNYFFLPKSKYLLPLFLILFSVGIFARLKKNIDVVNHYRMHTEKGMYCFQSEKIANFLSHPEKVHAGDVLMRSKEKRIYDFEKIILSDFDCTLNNDETPIYSLELYMALDSFIENDDTLFLSGWAFLTDKPFLTEKDSIAMRNIETGKEYFYSFKNELRPDVANHFDDPLKIMSGFYSRINVSNLENGFYKLGFKVDIDQQNHIKLYSEEDVEIKK